MVNCGKLLQFTLSMMRYYYTIKAKTCWFDCEIAMWRNRLVLGLSIRLTQWLLIIDIKSWFEPHWRHIYFVLFSYLLTILSVLKACVKSLYTISVPFFSLLFFACGTDNHGKKVLEQLTLVEIQNEKTAIWVRNGQNYENFLFSHFKWPRK